MSAAEAAAVPVPVPVVEGRSLIAVPIRGHCMEPEIFHGDIVIVDAAAEPAFGDVVVFTVRETGRSQVKRYHPHGEGRPTTFAPNRGALFELPVDGYRIDGVVVGSYRTVRRRPVIRVPVWAPWHELAPREEESPTTT